MKKNTFELKSGLAQMLKGGVIMDVMNVEQARIAEEAGAVAVMALERIPSLIRQHGGVARMSDPAMITRLNATPNDRPIISLTTGEVAWVNAPPIVKISRIPKPTYMPAKQEAIKYLPLPHFSKFSLFWDAVASLPISSLYTRPPPSLFFISRQYFD